MEFRVNLDLSSCRAFTRIDLAVLIVMVCVLASLANPFLSQSRVRSDVLLCQGNLAQIGRAYQLWGNDHEDQHPALVNPGDGGLRGSPEAGNIYIQFAWLSNQLASPKVLVCPADTNTVRRAFDFSSNPDGGLMHQGYRNNAVSYMTSLHAWSSASRAFVSGDRNVEPRQFNYCSYAQTAAQSWYWDSAWGRSIHWEKGNVLFKDGSVEDSSTEGLRRAIRMGHGRDLHVLSR